MCLRNNIHNNFLAVTVQRMGLSQQMVQETTTVAHQKVFWWEDRPLFCLAWLLYKNAHPSICCWSTLLLLWSPLHEFQWQYTKVQNTSDSQQENTILHCEVSPDKIQCMKTNKLLNWNYWQNWLKKIKIHKLYRTYTLLYIGMELGTSF